MWCSRTSGFNLHRLRLKADNGNTVALTRPCRLIGALIVTMTSWGSHCYGAPSRGESSSSEFARGEKINSEKFLSRKTRYDLIAVLNLWNSRSILCIRKGMKMLLNRAVFPSQVCFSRNKLQYGADKNDRRKLSMSHVNRNARDNSCATVFIAR